MNKNEKESIKKRSAQRYSLIRVSLGIKSLFKNPFKFIVLVVYLIVVHLFLENLRVIFDFSRIEMLIPFIDDIYKISIIFAAAAVLLILLEIFGTPMGANKISEHLQCIGLVNHAGEPPILIDKRRNRQYKNCTVMVFEAHGLPLYIWENKRKEIESALNLNIAKLEEGKNKRRILLHVVPAKTILSQSLHWSDTYLMKESFLLRIGESLIGPVTINLAKIPHVLLGGSTGSGKSLLLKVILMQCIKKGANVYISDFKGGVDFPAIWHQKCRFITSATELIGILDNITKELEERKKQFALIGCANVDEYNRLNDKPLSRIIFACDEVAELLDKNGLSKEKKDIVSNIESKLSTIARQGRAFGIHLILATQRPDATIIPGQIRNNIDCRICGRADNVLSQIILDSTDAADQIPKDAQGRFLMNDGTVFQGYLIDEHAALS